LRQQEPRIIWIDLGWKGTRLNIEIVEKKIVEKTESGDLVATRDGIINEIIVMQGKAVVKEGDTVTEGQTLIVGLKDEKGDKETARGIIKASVWYEETGEAALEYKEPVYTGKEKTSVAIRYNSFLVRFLPRPSYEKYTVDRSISKPFKWRNYSLPLEFIIEDYKQVEYLYYNRSEETAFYLARREAFEKILDKMDSEAIIIDVKTKKLELSGNRVGIKILLKTEENIGVLNNADKEDMSG